MNKSDIVLYAIQSLFGIGVLLAILANIVPNLKKHRNIFRKIYTPIIVTPVVMLFIIMGGVVGFQLLGMILLFVFAKKAAYSVEAKSRIIFITLSVLSLLLILFAQGLGDFLFYRGFTENVFNSVFQSLFGK